MHHLIFSSKFYRVSLFFPLCYQKKIASLSRELIAKINCYRGCGILPNRTHTKSWHSEFSITLLSLQPNPQLYERGSQVLMPLVGLCLRDCAYLCRTQDLVQLPSRWTLDDNDRHGHNHYYHQNSSHLLSTSFSDSVLSPQNNPQKEEEEDEYLFLTWESWVSERISNLIKVIESINSGLYSIFVKYPGQINFIQHSLWNRQIEKKKYPSPEWMKPHEHTAWSGGTGEMSTSTCPLSGDTLCAILCSNLQVFDFKPHDTGGLSSLCHWSVMMIHDPWMFGPKIGGMILASSQLSPNIFNFFLVDNLKCLGFVLRRSSLLIHPRQRVKRTPGAPSPWSWGLLVTGISKET